ncbi:putative alpha/Beta hydrolase [Helianthus annuus]|uniref:Alpha/Beta hydrolase n=1 Tax=Helianthus annuus TaxID=4232 RepID=A0A251VDL2_HELAN|nr:uncharacterized protein LOC110913521 [Helianthus annuus]KAF5817683.1 putative alpha/Beta hydrolase [Helianthus annuus]
MWGFGGRFYWGNLKKQEKDRTNKGIVVVFAWMSSQDKHLNNYIDLYSSFGWDSLVCHSQFLNLFFPDKATTLAMDILNELVKELKKRPCPVVFASFSGGPKACMYKALQIMDSKYESHGNLDEYRLVRDCLSGLIFDSSPVDFTSDLGTRFVLDPSILKLSRPPKIATLIANGISSSLDALFLTRFESQRAEYWQTLYASVGMGAPYLILCSENDNLAPYQIICNFAQRLESLGGDVKLVKWTSSPHVGHYRLHPDEYKSAVTELLTKAVHVYSTRTLRVSGSHNQPSEPLNHLREAVSSSNQYQSFHRITLDLNDHFVVPGSVEYHEGQDVGSVHDASKERFIPRSTPPKVNAHGILGQILFDVCVPKNVEDWDLRSSSSSSSSYTFASGRRPSHFNPMKCIRRSRL